MSFMRKSILISGLSILTIALACSRKAVPQSSEDDTTGSKSVTHFSGAVKELIVAKCSPCHIPASNGNKTPLDNYESAKKLADEIVRRVELNPGERGFMPFKKEKLSAEEISLLKKWRDEGAAE